MKFVDKNLAIKLKEKGYDKPCFNAYNAHGCQYLNGWCEYLNERDTDFIYLSDLHDKDCLCPTTDQVLEWLREEKKIYFNIFPYHFTGGIYCILNSIWQVNMDIKFETKEYDINIPYDTYEDACIAGIEYVVEHLI